jgi:Zn-dependent oligopeptidase
MVRYGASYYSYLYSRLYAANIWNKCFSNDPLSKESGLKVKRELFQKGGSRKPNEILFALTGSTLLDESVILPFSRE